MNSFPFLPSKQSGAGTPSTLTQPGTEAIMQVGSSHRQVVFVDSHVPDYTQLMRCMPEDSDVIVLQADANGLLQIAHHLQNRQGLKGIQIFSHGRSGEIQLGSLWLNAANLDWYKEVLEQIGAALNDDGELLLFGCEIAKGSNGRHFIDRLAALTNTRIAASTHLTGSEALEGSWTLDYRTGELRILPILDAASASDYLHVLALSAGDLAVFGWNSVGANNKVSIAALADIPAGTVVTFTDWGWMDVANGGPGFNSGNTTGDGKVVWTVGSTITAGTLMTLVYNGSGAVTFHDVTANSDLSSDVAVTGDSVGDPSPTSGDQFLIYQGADGSPTFVYGLNNSASATVGSDGWNTSIQLTSTDSLLPTGLTNGTNSIGFVTPHLQNVQYNGPTTATDAAGWLARLTNAANWTGDTNTGATTSAISLSNGTSINISNGPVVTTTGGSAAFTEGNNVTSTPVAVDSALTIGDPQSSTLATATVSITGNLQTAEDSLAFTNNPATMGNISAVYTAGTGVLALTSAGATATLAQWQAALRSITYTDSSETPNTSTRTVSFIVNDGTTDSSAVTRTVTVASVNDTPIATASGGTTAFTEGNNVTSTPVVVDSGVTVSDADSTTLASATVSITGNLQTAEDVLAFTNNPATMGNISAVYTAGTGVLALTSASATATLAQWQAALRSVTYTDSSDTPNTSNRTISFVVNDGNSNSTATTKTVSVASVNDTPVATASGGTTAFTEGNNVTSTPVAVDSGFTVSDADNATLASATVSITGNLQTAEDSLAFTNNPATMGNISAVYTAGTGVLALTSAGATATLAQWQAALRSVTYTDSSDTPNTSNRTITFVVNDGTIDSSATTKTVSVTSVNDSPVATTSGGTTAFTEGNNATSTPVTVDSGITVSDLDTSTLASATVSITGNLQTAEDSLAFTNNPATMGNISAVYTAGTGVLALTSAGATATLAQWQAALRSITYTNGSETPNTGNRTISFVVNDGTIDSSAGTKTVSVASVNDTPIATASGGTTAFTEAAGAVVVDNGVTVSDIDSTTFASATVSITGNLQTAEDVLAFTNNPATMGNISAVYTAGTGVLALTSAGATATLAQWQAALRSVTYNDTSAAPNTSNRTISFAVNDGSTSSSTTTKTVSVASVNDVPVATTSGGTTAFTEGNNVTSTPVAVDSGITVSDADNTTLASATVSITGNLQTAEDVLAFTNNPATMGNISAVYTAGTGVLALTSAGATATLAQWQAALRSVTYTDSSETPNTSNRTISFVVNDGTINSSAGTKTVSVASVNDTPVATASGGTTAFAEGNNTTSSPVAVDSGFTVSDLDNATLSSATVSITGNLQTAEDTLAFTNNPATMGNISAVYTAGTGILALTSAGATATLAQWQAALRSITYTNSSENPNTANRTVSFVVNDGTANSSATTKTVSVSAVNDSPVATTNGGAATFTEGGAAAVIDNGITVADLDTTTLASATVSITGNFQTGEDVLAFTNNPATMGNISANYTAGTGVLALTSAGATATLAQWQAALQSITYSDTSTTPNTTSRTVSFVLNDGNSDSAAATRAVTVIALAKAPAAATSAGTASFVEGNGATIIDSAITVSDQDSATLASATVRITGNFQPGEDILAFSNTGSMGNISAAYNAATGTLTLTSSGATATLAQWQTALRSVTYSDNSATPNTSTRSISFVLNDGVNTGAAGVKPVAVTATDTSPSVATSAGASSTFVYNNAVPSPVIVDGSLTVSDLDSPTFASARVSITGNYNAGEDVLVFVNTPAMGNITGSYSNGVLNLSSVGATATQAQWQAALRSVAYQDTVVGAATGSRVISFVVNDGNSSSATAIKTVTLFPGDTTPPPPVVTPPVNSPPIIVPSPTPTVFTKVPNQPASPVVIDTSLTVGDSNDVTLTSGSVVISGHFVAGQDVLAFTNNPATMGNIRGTYHSDTGVLNLISDGATATVAQWQNALRSVTYTDTANNPDLQNRTISFQVTDGAAYSSVATHVVALQTESTPSSASIALSEIAPRNAPAMTFQVSFSENVSGVDLGDFTLSPTGSAHGTLSGVTKVDDSHYQVRVTGISGEGSLALGLNTTDTHIVNDAGNPVSGDFVSPAHIVHTDIRSSTSQEKVAALYVLDFGRAPDQTGLDYWTNEMAHGRNLNDIALSFAGHSRFLSDYGSLNDRQFVEAIYKNGLGNSGDTTGVNYWTDKISQGESRSDMLAEFAIAVLGTDLVSAHASGQLSDADYQAAVVRQNMLLNRVDVGLEFVKQLGNNTVPVTTTDADKAYQASQQILAHVDGTDGSLSDAVIKVKSAASIDQILSDFPVTPLPKLVGVPETLPADAASHFG